MSLGEPGGRNGLLLLDAEDDGEAFILDALARIGQLAFVLLDVLRGSRERMQVLVEPGQVFQQ